MDKFLVPQYIDVEPKIIGPITIRQFIELLVGGLIGFILYKVFTFNVFIVLVLIDSAVFLIITFFKINGMPFHYFVLNLVMTLRRPSLRVWRKIELKALPKKEEVKKEEKIPTKTMISQSKLSDLSLLIDTGGAYNIKDFNDNNK